MRESLPPPAGDSPHELAHSGAGAPRPRRQRGTNGGRKPRRGRNEGEGTVLGELNVLGRVLQAIKRLSKPQQAALLSLIVLVVAVSLIVRFVSDDTPQMVMVLIGLMCGTVPLVAYPRNGLPSAVAVFTFTLAALFLLTPRTERSAAPISKLAADTTPEPIFGKVFDQRARTGIDGAVVRVLGYGPGMAYTDSSGSFHLLVPRYILRNDSVRLGVHMDVETVFGRALGERPFNVFIRTAAPGSSRADQRASPPLGLSAPFGAPGAHAAALAQNDVVLRVVVDSIRAVLSGGFRQGYWEFELEVNDGEEYEIPQALYTRRANVVLVAGERRFRVPLRGTVELGIEGSRRRNILSAYRVRGTTPVPLESLRPNVPFSARVAATSPGHPEYGSFEVFLTLIRLSAVR